MGTTIKSHCLSVATPPQPHRWSTVRYLAKPHVSLSSPKPQHTSFSLCYFTNNYSGGGRRGGINGGSGGGSGSDGDEDDEEDRRAKVLNRFIKVLSKTIADEQRKLSPPSTNDSFFSLFNNVGLGLVLGGVIDRMTGGCFSGFFLNKTGKEARGI